MGNCIGVNPPDEQTTRIDAESRVKKTESDKILKLLWLGPGESGKSTLFRRLKAIYGDSYSEDERLSYRVPVCNNVVSFMKILVQFAKTSLPEDFKDHFDDKTTEAAEILETFSDGDDFDKHRALVVMTLWSHPAIKYAFAQRSKCHVPDSSAYFFDKVEELGDYRYIPSEEDCLRSRIRTLGIIETTLEAHGQRFRMLDVGGQKNERRKWIQCFEDVSAVLFVVALSEYDQQMFEDDLVNRMTDSLSLFSEIANDPAFSQSTTVLFLNKKDLFREKIKRVPLTVCFPKYDGPQTYEAGVKYIESEFKKLSDLTHKKVYVHLTCGLDQSDVESAFVTTLDMIKKEQSPEASDSLA